MKNNQKTFQSVIVLSAIAFVATTFLIILNAILPGPPAFGLTEALPHLEKIMPGSEFEIYEYNKLDDFNLTHGDDKVKLTMVYRATSGEYKDNFAIRFSTVGYSGNKIDALVGYDRSSAILGVGTINNTQTAPSGNTYLRPGFNEYFVENGSDPNIPIPPNTVPDPIGTGASTSFRSYVAGVNLATRLAMDLNDIEVIVDWTVANTDETNILRNLTNDQNAVFSRASGELLEKLDLIADYNKTDLVAVFVKRTGDGANKTVIIESKGNGGSYGEISVMTVFDLDVSSGIPREIILEMAIGTLNTSSPSRPGQTAFNDVSDKYIEIIKNLDRSALESFDESSKWDHTNNIFDTDTGASTGGNTGMGNASIGFILAVKHGYQINDVLDYDLIRDIIVDVAVPN